MEKEEYKKLIDNYLSGTITEAERIKLVNWLVYDTGVDIWWASELNGMSDEMPPGLQTHLLAEMKSKILKETDAKASELKSRSLKKRIRMSLLKWAAIICIPVLLGVSLYYTISSGGDNFSPLIVTAERGERSSVELPDGTRVKLNSATKLTYPGSFGRERRVKLSGEAYFDVAHDKEHPFIVELGAIDVRVLGTSFNISSYEDQENIVIVLLKGKVEVISGIKNYVMHPNDKVVYNKTTSVFHSTKVCAGDYIEWTKGSLYFENESLETIANALSRTYNIDIRFASDGLKKERFTGTIGNGGLKDALERLRLASPILYEIRDSVIVLKRKVLE